MSGALKTYNFSSPSVHNKESHVAIHATTDDLIVDYLLLLRSLPSTLRTHKLSEMCAICKEFRMAMCTTIRV